MTELRLGTHVGSSPAVVQTATPNPSTPAAGSPPLVTQIRTSTNNVDALSSEKSSSGTTHPTYDRSSASGESSAQHFEVPLPVARHPRTAERAPPRLTEAQSRQLEVANAHFFAEHDIANPDTPLRGAVQHNLDAPPPPYEGGTGREEWMRTVAPILNYDQAVGLPMSYHPNPTLDYQAARSSSGVLGSNFGLRLGLMARGVGRSIRIAGDVYGYMGSAALSKTKFAKAEKAAAVFNSKIDRDESLVKNDFKRAFSVDPRKNRLHVTTEGKKFYSVFASLRAHR